jgi:predicted nucleotidyltransferase
MVLEEVCFYQQAIALPIEAIANFCQRWNITQLALPGSVLRDDFHTDTSL